MMESCDKTPDDKSVSDSLPPTSTMRDFPNRLLECPICGEVLQRAFETTCGHAFCDQCIRQAVLTQGNICPVCRQNPQPIHPSYTIRKIIEELKLPDVQKASNKELENAMSLSKAGKYNEAIQAYSDIKKPTALIYGNRAYCYLKLGKLNEAVSDCDRALSLNSASYVWIYIFKALSLEQLKEHGKAYAAILIGKRLDVKSEYKKEIQTIVDRLLRFVSLEKPQQLYFTPTLPISHFMNEHNVQ